MKTIAYKWLLVLSVNLALVSQLTAADFIRLATTTSTYNSGLLDHLLKRFNSVSDVEVQVIAVGTGKALRLGMSGDVDLVMTHAPLAEADFVEQDFGIEPKTVMYNDFIIVGPVDDPANLARFSNVDQGMQAIASAEQPFISRGDNSGTHKKELQLWQAIGQSPDFKGYLQSGRGMGHTLQMASELRSYTLTDRGTWLALQEKLHLAVVLQAVPHLLNPYQVILINPERHPHVKTRLARQFIDWLVGAAGQQAIGEFRINGEVLFVPSANSN